MTADARRRLAAVVVVAGVLVGGGVADRVVPRATASGLSGGPAVAAAAQGTASAVISGSRASSSAWYCAGLAAAPSGATASVVMTNSGATSVTGELQARAAGGSGSQGRGFAVPAAGELAVPEGASGAAEVLLDGGGVGALEVVSGPLGWSAAPCAAQAAPAWYFAHGSTASGSTTQLALFNPSPADAVVNATFVSATKGVEAPPAFQGIPVPAGTVVVENVGDHVQDDASFGTEVTALSGAVVADEMIVTGTPGQGGMSILNGSPSPEARWAFAQNTDLTGGGNVFSILNPTNQAATVTVSISLAQGQAAPITLPVGANSVASLSAQDQTRIPTLAVFGAAFSSNGPGIVVSREAFVASGVAPNRGQSVASVGSQSRWLLPPIPPPGTSTWALGVLDVAGRPLRVTIAALQPSGRWTPLPGDRSVLVRPGALLVLGPNPAPPVGTLPVEVVADGPVVVELDPEPVAAPGTAVVPGWPFLQAQG